MHTTPEPRPVTRVYELAPGRHLIPVPACPGLALVVIEGPAWVTCFWRVAGTFVRCPSGEA